MNATARARAYLAKLPPALAGSGGHAATFAAACRLVEFGLAWESAWPLLLEWNGTHCQPPWCEQDLRHKLADAFRRTSPKADFTGHRAWNGERGKARWQNTPFGVGTPVGWQMPRHRQTCSLKLPGSEKRHANSHPAQF